MKRAGRSSKPRIHFVSRYSDIQHRDRFFLDEQGRVEQRPRFERRPPQDPLLFYQEHHRPMPIVEFLSGFSHPELLIQEDSVDIFEHDWAPMPLDDFLAEMGWEEPAFEGADFDTEADFQAPNTFNFPVQPMTSGWDTLYPGHANIPCLGVRTDNDNARTAKAILLKEYDKWNLELRCHTCGKNLRGGKIAYGIPFENVWIGDHQPPTSAHRWPAKMQVITSFTQPRNIQVVESPCGMFQTRYPVPAKLTSLFLGQRPHPYPLYPKNKVLPQRYIYPQCEACSRLQSHNL